LFFLLLFCCFLSLINNTSFITTTTLQQHCNSFYNLLCPCSTAIALAMASSLVLSVGGAQIGSLYFSDSEVLSTTTAAADDLVVDAERMSVPCCSCGLADI
jgi:hypothetical protein